MTVTKLAYTPFIPQLAKVEESRILHFSFSSLALISLYGRFGMGLFECWIF